MKLTKTEIYKILKEENVEKINNKVYYFNNLLEYIICNQKEQNLKIEERNWNFLIKNTKKNIFSSGENALILIIKNDINLSMENLILLKNNTNLYIKDNNGFNILSYYLANEKFKNKLDNVLITKDFEKILKKQSTLTKEINFSFFLSSFDKFNLPIFLYDKLLCNIKLNENQEKNKNKILIIKNNNKLLEKFENIDEVKKVNKL